MFKFKIDSKRLKDYVNAIAVLVDEASFKIEPAVMKLRAMDPSRVVMVDFELPKTAFIEYDCSVAEKFCVNLTELGKLIKRTGTYKAGKGAMSEEIELSKGETSDKLKIVITGRYARTFTLSTLQPSEEEIPTPQLLFNVRAKIATSTLTQAIDDAQIVSDHVRIESDPEQLILNAAGDLMGAVITIKKDSDAQLFELEVKEPSKATYSLSYLAEIMKAALATSDLATIEYSTDMLIKVDFMQPIPETKLTYFLAPRIETE